MFMQGFWAFGGLFFVLELFFFLSRGKQIKENNPSIILFLKSHNANILIPK